MISVSRVFTFVCFLHAVISDGYPKESPAQSFNSGDISVPASQDNTILSSTSNAGVHGDSKSNGQGLAGTNLGGYDYSSARGSDGSGAQVGFGSTVSTDYSSKYHGPIAMPMVLADGTIADTPEVAAARAAHLAALNKAKALWFAKGNSGSGDSKSNNAHGLSGTGQGGHDYSTVHGSGAQSGLGSTISTDYTSKYHGPIAVPMVLADGTIANTPEVAAARAAHLTALDKAKALWSGQSNSAGSYGGSWPANMPYHGPLATLTVLPSGYLADTPAIATARAAHLSAHLKAQAAWKPQDWKPAVINHY